MTAGCCAPTRAARATAPRWRCGSAAGPTSSSRTSTAATSPARSTGASYAATTSPSLPDEGLRHGRNVLRIRAVHRGGGYDIEERTITVARSRPLAAAGRDRRHPARAPITLDGRRSRAATSGARLRHRWVLAATPRGSKARLRAAGTARPTLTPDLPGRYRIRLTVRETSRGARTAQIPAAGDTVEVAATQPPNPLGIPIATLTATNGTYATVVGGQTIAPPSGGPVSLVVIDSATGAVSDSYGFTAGQDAAASQLVQGLATGSATQNAIVALSALPGAAVGPGWDQIIKQISGAELGATALGSGGWSVIGNPTTSDGVANATDAARNRPLGAVTGYVQNQVALSRYTFVTGGYVSYATRANGSTATTNTMTVGAATYPSTDVRDKCDPGEDAAGFQVVLLDAGTLELISSSTNTTRCGSRMYLPGYNNFADEVVLAATPAFRTLILIQSIGTTPILPSGPAEAPSSEKFVGPPSVGVTAMNLAAALTRLGGDPSTFLNPIAATAQGANRIAPSADLAFVGGTYRDATQTAQPVGDAAEAFSGIPGATPPAGSADGRALRGTLRRGARWQYEPATSTTIADAPPDLNTVAYQAPTPWPFTAAGGGTPAQQAAYRYLSLRVLGELFTAGRYPSGACTRARQRFGPATADIRQLYCATTIDPTGDIADVTWPGGITTFTRADLRTVKTGLAKELTWVASSRALFADLASAYDGEGGQTPQIDSIVTNVHSAIDPDAGATVAGTWLGIASDVANLAASIFGIPDFTADVASAINLISAAGFTASDALSAYDFSTDATDLATEAAARSESIAETIRAMPAIFATDYGKLEAIAATSLSDTQDVDTAVHLAFGRWAARRARARRRDRAHGQPGRDDLSPPPAGVLRRRRADTPQVLRRPGRARVVQRRAADLRDAPRRPVELPHAIHARVRTRAQARPTRPAGLPLQPVRRRLRHRRRHELWLRQAELPVEHGRHPVHVRAGPDAPLTAQQRWVLVAGGLAVGLAFLDETAVVTALRAMQADFGATSTETQWVMGAYLLALASFIAVAGRLADLHGRRRLFLVGVGLFGAGSLAAAAAPSEEALIAARAVQGAGAALLVPLGMANATAALPEERRGWAVGIVSTGATVFLALGPLIGGGLTELVGWRWIFLVNLPAVAAIAWITLRWMPETRGAEREPIDVPGLVLLVAGLVTLVLALLNMAGWGPTAPVTLALLTAGVGLLAAFVVVERRVPSPLVDLDLLRIPAVTGSLCALFAIQFSILGLTVYVTLYLQHVLGYSPGGGRSDHAPDRADRPVPRRAVGALHRPRGRAADHLRVDAARRHRARGHRARRRRARDRPPPPRVPRVRDRTAAGNRRRLRNRHGRDPPRGARRVLGARERGPPARCGVRRGRPRAGAHRAGTAPPRHAARRDRRAPGRPQPRSARRRPRRLGRGPAPGRRARARRARRRPGGRRHSVRLRVPRRDARRRDRGRPRGGDQLAAAARRPQLITARAGRASTSWRAP
ncbi:MFS transporter [Svornostia abyssi]|uniref:MFS transporter n=1 Tax=Svornostia abyssi TaxID=2898438 RepID=A0ABY5PE66_9ACTN|nr:MFS transporter [Parviterribacteraceae bacterium J379]